MRAAPVTLAIAIALTPTSARAAACCGTGYGVGQRLAVAEDAAFTLTSRLQATRGSYDDAGRWVRDPATDMDRELRTDLSVHFKPIPALQLGASAPFVATWRRTADLEGRGAGVGDANVFGRWDFVPVGGRGDWPGVAATLSVGLPTGRSADKATDVLGADATGLGVFEVRPGFAIEKAWWRGWFAVFASSIAFRTPHDSRGGTVQLGPRWSTVLAGGPSFRWGLGVALGVQHDREAAPTTAGVRGVGRSRTSLVLVASYEIDLHWSIVLAAQADPPIAGLGRNEPGVLSGTLGLRFARSVYD